jgi:hypothetical protein
MKKKSVTLIGLVLGLSAMTLLDRGSVWAEDSRMIRIFLEADAGDR